MFRWLPIAFQDILLDLISQAASRGVIPRRAVVSCDIDDTLFPSLFDSSFSGSRLYPGVLSLLECMRAGSPVLGQPDSPSLPPPLAGVSRGTLGFVTARPSLLRSSTRSALQERKVQAYTLMSGPALPSLRHATLAADKLKHLRRMRQLWPGRRMVWIGDMGQADAQVGSQLAAEHPDQGGGYLSSGGPLVLVHDIVPSVSTAMPGTNLSTRQVMASEHVFVFDSYVDAAVLALQAGVISCAGALQVAATCCREAGVHPPSIRINPAEVRSWLMCRTLPATAPALGVPMCPVPEAQAWDALAAEARAALAHIAGCTVTAQTETAVPVSLLGALPMGMGLYGAIQGDTACSCHCPVPGVRLEWRGYQHVARYHQLHSPASAMAESSKAHDAGAASVPVEGPPPALPAALEGPPPASTPILEQVPSGAAYVLKDSPWFPVAEAGLGASIESGWSCQQECSEIPSRADEFPTLQHAAHGPSIKAALTVAKQLRELPACTRALELQAAVGRLAGFVAALACVGVTGPKGAGCKVE